MGCDENADPFFFHGWLLQWHAEEQYNHYSTPSDQVGAPIAHKLNTTTILLLNLSSTRHKPTYIIFDITNTSSIAIYKRRLIKMTTTAVAAYLTPRQTNDTCNILLCPSPPRNRQRYCNINAACPTMPICLDDGMTTLDSVLGVDLSGVTISRDVKCTDIRRKSFAIPAIQLKPRPSKYTPPSRLHSKNYNMSIKKKAVLTRSSSYQNVKSLKMTRSCSYQHLLAKSFQHKSSLHRSTSFSSRAAWGLYL